MVYPAVRGAEKSSSARAAKRERAKKGHAASKSKSIVLKLPAFEVALEAVNVAIRALEGAKGELVVF